MWIQKNIHFLNKNRFSLETENRSRRSEPQSRSFSSKAGPEVRKTYLFNFRILLEPESFSSSATLASALQLPPSSPLLTSSHSTFFPLAVIIREAGAIKNFVPGAGTGAKFALKSEQPRSNSDFDAADYGSLLFTFGRSSVKDNFHPLFYNVCWVETIKNYWLLFL